MMAMENIKGIAFFLSIILGVLGFITCMSSIFNNGEFLVEGLSMIIAQFILLFIGKYLEK